MAVPTQHDHTCVVLTTGQVMCLRRSGEWVALPEQPEPMASILVDGRDTESSFTALSRTGKLWTWEAVGPAAGVVTYAAPTAVAGPSGAVQRLAKGDGRTCVVLTGGVVSCRGTDSGGAATWVPVPGVAGAAPVTVLEDRVFFVDSAGTPRVYKIEGARAVPQATKGVPAPVTGFEASFAGAEITSLTADGSMRMHDIFGEFDGRVTLLARNVDTLVGNACGMRGQVLGCGKPRWDSPNGFVAPASTTVERVADTWVRLSDGAAVPGAATHIPRADDGRARSGLRRLTPRLPDAAATRPGGGDARVQGEAGRAGVRAARVRCRKEGLRNSG